MFLLFPRASVGSAERRSREARLIDHHACGRIGLLWFRIHFRDIMLAATAGLLLILISRNNLSTSGAKKAKDWEEGTYVCTWFY